MKKSTEKCPICDEFLYESVDYMDHILMSKRQDCQYCKRYLYDYDTGNTAYFIGTKDNNKEFIHSYLTEKTILAKKSCEMFNWIRVVRSEWRKFHDVSGNPIVELEIA